MGMLINGISGTYSIPSIGRRYVHTKYHTTTLEANVSGVRKVVTVRTVLDAAWAGIVQRSLQKACNDCFKKLFRKKTLAEILAEGDIVLNSLEPKSGQPESVLPYANTAARNIGINPVLFFESDPNLITCTLVHEIAHIGGASTNPAAAPAEAHAAEGTLMNCGCTQQYDSTILGSIKMLTPAALGGPRLA